VPPSSLIGPDSPLRRGHPPSPLEELPDLVRVGEFEPDCDHAVEFVAQPASYTAGTVASSAARSSWRALIIARFSEWLTQAKPLSIERDVGPVDVLLENYLRQPGRHLDYL
jgi:hypothetical protein